jgi:hypothetical protein
VVTPLERVLTAVEVVRRPDEHGEYLAFCVGHNDRTTPNLHIREAEDGTVLIWCSAGCPQDRVLDALEERGVFRSDLFGVRDGGRRDGSREPGSDPPQTWEVRDAEGEVQAIHVRYDRDDSKDCYWRLPGSQEWGLGGHRLESLPLYGSERARNWPGDLPLVVVAEGEPATDALLDAGFSAVGTVTGASGTPGPEALEVLRGRRVVLWCDNDEPGRAHMERVAAALHGVAADVRIFDWAGAPERGDAADHPAVRSRSREGIGELIDEMARTPSWVPKNATGSITAPYVATPGGAAGSSPPWPVLGKEALYGLAGDIVTVVDPHTEADPVAVLTNLLVAIGNAVGRGAYCEVGADRHHLNLFAALVGESGKGRKGMSWGPVRDLMSAADPFWGEDRVSNGLSSGEGLIYAVRDRILDTDKNGDPIVVDEGVDDKRLLVLESELASVLKVMGREGNTLSPVVRQAWDGGKLQTLTKNSPTKATDPHVSLIGHMTTEELRRYLSKTEAANGFANRFLFILVRRSKVLPFGGD